MTRYRSLLLTAVRVTLPVLSIVGCSHDAQPVRPTSMARPDGHAIGPRARCLASASVERRARGPLRCFARIGVKTMQKSSPTCWLDTVVGKEAGDLTFDCSGGGALEVIFGKHRFRGTIDRCRIAAEHHTSFDWSDGCKWLSTQRLAGKLGSGPLTWSYREQALPGQRNCAPPCSARGSLVVW